jgi:putative oxidoreductase
MDRILNLVRLHGAFGAALDHLQSPLLLVTRVWVSWQFLKSGWLKVSSWDTTLWLFRDEYRVPLLPPEVAAVAGTAGELAFPLLLIAGLFGRIGALGLSAVNAMAVVSYAHVLLAEGAEAALAQHVLWGFMLAVLVVFGCGRYTVDRWLESHAAARCRPPLVAGGAAGG